MSESRLRHPVLASRLPLSRLGGQFYTWWRNEFFALVPDKFAKWLLGDSRNSLVVDAAGAFVEIQLVSNGGECLATERYESDAFSIAAVDGFLSARKLDRSVVDIGIRLRADQVFSRTLKLPIQAERQLDPIATRDLTAKTPFRLSDIYVSLSHTKDVRTVVVSQWIVLRRIVADAVALLKLDLSDIIFVERLIGTSNPARRVRIPIRPADRPKISRFSAAAASLIVSAATLAFLAAAAEYWHQQSILDSLDAKVAAARVKAQGVRAAVEKLTHQKAVLLQLRTRKTDTPGFLDLWEEASRLLPSHTWLTELRLSQAQNDTVQQVSMAGFSSEASTLVGVIDQSGRFTDTSLTAPITVDSTLGRERFSLQTRVRPYNLSTKKNP